jgi:hypothetical protein
MSKTKGQTFRYRFGTKPKHFGIVPEFVLKQFASIWSGIGLLDKIEMISFDKTNSGTN